MKHLLFLIICFTPLHAQANLWGGRIYADQYLSTIGGSDTNRQSSISTWLDFDAHPEDRGVGMRAIGQADFLSKNIDPTIKSNQVYFNLREAYFSYLGPGVELKVGEQIIPWGKSDGVNPTDYFTAKDLTILNPDEEVKRRGAPAVNLNFTPNSGVSPFSFNLIFQSAYTPMKLLIPTQSIPANINFQKYVDTPKPFDPDHFSYGGKISYQKSNFDCSLSAFSGTTQYSEYALLRNSMTIVPFNPTENAFGGDASFTLGTVVVRMESAVHLPDNGSDADPLAGIVEPYHWDTVIGFERPIVNDDWRVQIQGLYRYHFSYANQPRVTDPNAGVAQINRALASANALILNDQNQSNPGLTARLSYNSDHSSFTGDIFMLGYFGGGQSYLLRPQLGYTPVENLKLLSGFDLYDGDTTQPLGALHNQSDWFFEAKYLF